MKFFSNSKVRYRKVSNILGTPKSWLGRLKVDRTPKIFLGRLKVDGTPKGGWDA